MSILYNSTLVVGLSVVIFFVLLWYLGVHKFLGKKLDERAQAIRSELDEARKLREEAQELFAEFERKQKQVQEQAEDITAKARQEAEAAAVRAKEDIKVSIDRRMKAADEQIALAEQNAIKEVRDRAAAIAIAAAAEVLANRIGDSEDDRLIQNAIEKVSTRLH